MQGRPPHTAVSTETTVAQDPELRRQETPPIWRASVVMRLNSMSAHCSRGGPRKGAGRTLLSGHLSFGVLGQHLVDEGLVAHATALRLFPERGEHSRVQTNGNELTCPIPHRRPAHSLHRFQLLGRRIRDLREINPARGHTGSGPFTDSASAHWACRIRQFKGLAVAIPWGFQSPLPHQQTKLFRSTTTWRDDPLIRGGIAGVRTAVSACSEVQKGAPGRSRYQLHQRSRDPLCDTERLAISPLPESADYTQSDSRQSPSEIPVRITIAGTCAVEWGAEAARRLSDYVVVAVLRTPALLWDSRFGCAEKRRCTLACTMRRLAFSAFPPRMNLCWQTSPAHFRPRLHPFEDRLRTQRLASVRRRGSAIRSRRRRDSRGRDDGKKTREEILIRPWMLPSWSRMADTPRRTASPVAKRLAAAVAGAECLSATRADGAHTGATISIRVGSVVSSPGLVGAIHRISKWRFAKAQPDRRVLFGPELRLARSIEGGDDAKSPRQRPAGAEALRTRRLSSGSATLTR